MPDTAGATTTLPTPGTCCPASDPATRGACALCGRPTCRRCRALVNGRTVCSRCAVQIRDELSAEVAGSSALPGAILGGLVGALVGGAIWAGVAIASGLAIGFVAVLVGYLAGFGVVQGARKKKSTQLQGVAVACALLGLLAGKYLIVAHTIKTMVPDADLGYLDGRILEIFFQHLGEFFRVFDVLWIVLAFGAALRVTRPTATRVRMSDVGRR
jgi:hypothetical protein